MDSSRTWSDQYSVFFLPSRESWFETKWVQRDSPTNDQIAPKLKPRAHDLHFHTQWAVNCPLRVKNQTHPNHAHRLIMNNMLTLQSHIYIKTSYSSYSRRMQSNPMVYLCRLNLKGFEIAVHYGLTLQCLIVGLLKMLISLFHNWPFEKNCFKMLGHWDTWQQDSGPRLLMLSAQSCTTFFWGV